MFIGAIGNAIGDTFKAAVEDQERSHAQWARLVKGTRLGETNGGPRLGNALGQGLVNAMAPAPTAGSGDVVDEFTGGLDFAADVSQRRSELARQEAAVFASSLQRRFFDDGVLLGSGTPQAAGYPTPGGGWVGEGKTGVQNVGSISATRFALDDLPAQYQSAYGPVRLARDAVGQGYLAVPIDDQGAVKFYSPPADYEVPSLAALQGRVWGRGVAAGVAGAPSAARDLFEAAADFFDGAFNPNAQAQSPITQAIRDGRVTGSSLLYGLVESSPVGILTNMGIGTPESLYNAGQSTGGAAVFGAAGLVTSSGLRLSAGIGTSVGEPGLRLGGAAAIHPGQLAAESAEVTQQSLLRALRQAGTPESLATAKLMSRGKLDVNILATDPSGRGLGGLYRFGAREIEIYSNAFSTPTQAAGYATHETTHFMQGLSPSNYNLGHEFDAFRAQGAVDLGHWTRRLSDAALYDLLTRHPVYRGVRPDPNWPR